MTGRLQLTFLIIVFGFSLIIARLFYWQVVKADELSLLGKAQYGTQVTLSPKRGEIKTSDDFPIATNKLTYLLFLNPKEIKDKQYVLDVLPNLIHVDQATVSADLLIDKFWVPIKRGIDPTTREQVEARKIPGVGFEEESVRFYPEASLAAQLLGFVGKSETGEDQGYFGIEGYYDRQLRGKTTIVEQIHDAFGRPILSQKKADTSSEKEGRSLVLSIDRTIQYIVEKKLADGVERFGAASGMVGVIDPHTGEILAMASFPSFDPRTYQDYDDTLYKNPFISNLYEPGSTFKSLVMAAGIDSKVVKPDTKCPICEKPVSIGGYEIKTWNDKYFKDITMTDVIQHSDNTGMVYVGKSLGLPRLLSYLRKFGIGSLSGIDLQGEEATTLRPENEWYPIDLATASFGQGITVTPIALLSAFSSLANDGVRMEPHVVKKIETDDGQTIPIAPKELDRPISPAAAKVMTEILVNAVNKGEAQWARLKGYRIAGKTGTAQIPIAGHYDPTKTIASFIGFAPADNPRFAMLVVIDRPTSSIYGAETAAPVFFDIARDILTYEGISPTEEITNEK